MAPNLTLADAYTVEFAATDPATGADVTGVDVSNVSILIGGDDNAATFGQGQFRLVPGPGA